MSRIVIIHQNDGSDVRIGKICRTLSQTHDVTFLGWRKSNTNFSPKIGNAASICLNLETTNGRATLFGLSVFFIWSALKVLKIRPDIIYCVNEDLSAIFGSCKFLHHARVVCDIFDPIADRKTSSRLHPVLKQIQNVGRKLANTIVVTDRNRYQRLEENYRSKSVVVENFPECDVLPVVPNHRSREDNCIYIAFVGSISLNRGVRHLKHCLQRLPNLRIMCAGWLYDESAREFVKDINVEYLGVLTAEESRGVMSICDYVLCIYDPSVLNNRNASPNKIFDAMSVGRPVLINREILVADFVKSNNLGYLYTYDHINDLVSLLKNNEAEGPSPRSINHGLIETCKRTYSWESQRMNLYQAIKSQ